MQRKILVVDDDPYLTTQLRKTIESDELSVDTVSSTQEARVPGISGLQCFDHRFTHARHERYGIDP